MVVVSYLGDVWPDYRTDLVSQRHSGGSTRKDKRMAGGGRFGLWLLVQAWVYPWFSSTCAVRVRRRWRGVVGWCCCNRVLLLGLEGRGSSAALGVVVGSVFALV